VTYTKTRIFSPSRKSFSSRDTTDKAGQPHRSRISPFGCDRSCKQGVYVIDSFDCQQLLRSHVVILRVSRLFYVKAKRQMRLDGRVRTVGKWAVPLTSRRPWCHETLQIRSFGAASLDNPIKESRWFGKRRCIIDRGWRCGVRQNGHGELVGNCRIQQAPTTLPPQTAARDTIIHKDVQFRTHIVKQVNPALPRCRIRQPCYDDNWSSSFARTSHDRRYAERNSPEQHEPLHPM